MAMDEKKLNKILLIIIIFSIQVILLASVVIGTPYLFVRILNTIVLVISSCCLGAFIREAFILYSQIHDKTKQRKNQS